MQTSLLKYITPISNQTNTYCVSIGSGLYDSNPSNNDGDGSDGGANQCKKNLLSYLELSELTIDLESTSNLKMMDLAT